MDGVTHGASAWKSNSRDRRYYRQGGSDEFAAIERVAADRGLPPSTVARERLLAMTREDQGAAADVVAVLFDVVDQLRAVATRMNLNAVGA